MGVVSSKTKGFSEESRLFYEREDVSDPTYSATNGKSEVAAINVPTGGIGAAVSLPRLDSQFVGKRLVREKAVGIDEVVICQSKLPKIIGTLHPPCGFACRLHGGQKKGD